MKKINISLLFIFFALSSFAQDLEPDQIIKPASRHEAGFNASRLIASFFASSEDLDSFGDYAFIYKLHTHSGGAFRLGIGGNFSDRNEVINNQDNRSSQNIIGNARFGYEFRKSIASKWTLLFGADGTFSYRDITNSFESNIDVTITRDEQLIYGASPFLGLEFKLNERIRVSTELALQVSIIDSKQSDTFQNFPEFNTSNSEQIVEYQLNSPGFIYLTIRL